jgi:hypothetical protein
MEDDYVKIVAFYPDTERRFFAVYFKSSDGSLMLTEIDGWALYSDGSLEPIDLINSYEPLSSVSNYVETYLKEFAAPDVIALLEAQRRDPANLVSLAYLEEQARNYKRWRDDSEERRRKKDEERKRRREEEETALRGGQR